MLKILNTAIDPCCLSSESRPDLKVAVRGTFEAIHKNGMLHVGVTYPSTGRRPEGVAVPADLIEACAIRPGDVISGGIRRQRNGVAVLQTVRTLSDVPVGQARQRPDFYRMTPIYPTEQLRLGVRGEAGFATMDAIDALAPIGKGSRVLVSAPAGSGKTRLLAMIASSLQTNHPEVDLYVLMFGGWPDEVTRMRGRVRCGEVISSDACETRRNHVRAAVATIERAKRLVEMKRDVAVLIDGVDILAEACNRIGAGRGLGCAVWANAVSLFGAARNLEEGGSLTIVAAISERPDDSTGRYMAEASNAAIHLTPGASAADKFPMIDPRRSWARRSDLLRQSPPRAAGRSC